MNQKIRILAEQILVAMGIFIAFLLLFESKLMLPLWLQSAGRLHPLLLHFPIVLLVVALLMSFFENQFDAAGRLVVQQLSRTIYLTGVFLAGVTVVFGIFLSQEGGYAAEPLQGHKWTGSGLYFAGIGTYFLIYIRPISQTFARVASVFVVVGLIVTGHLGATLTHGEGYVLAPFQTKTLTTTVALEDAIVFEHVIQPILEQKCISCHNEDKQKGELLLVSQEALLKGGKSGKLFVAGNPEISLLLQRIHLPMNEKKHMPPTGKVQLTEEEKTLLALWIQAKANFKLKITDLPATDSLRLVASRLLSPATLPEERYAFEPADAQTLARLQTDYRTIAPLAVGSPAVAVNVYNQAQFSRKTLEELLEIQEQVVSLTLAKMPVTDADLDLIASFKNLRKLNLNFTEIAGTTLPKLSALPSLHTLTLTGTKVTFGQLAKNLPQLKSLKQVSVWDTDLTPQEQTKLQKLFPGISFALGFQEESAAPLQLNPPQVQNQTLVFNQKLPVKLMHPIRDVEIRYTTDGSEPDSLTSPVFKSLIITENTKLVARAFKKGWYGSSSVSFDFLKNSFQPDSLRLLYPLNRVHLAEGAHTFFDGKLGAIGANNPAWANFWAGARAQDMGVEARFDNPVTISSFGLHYMIEEDTGIFPPEWVEVWGGNDPEHVKLLMKLKPPMPAKGDSPTLKIAQGSCVPVSVKYLKIVARPLTAIPAWHRSKGNKALLLVDELFLN
ncbi:c-type cytochrome domain-containing protein [Arundinibacter roseus]|uniref:Cytochrome C n=1 Tax=Arundinibacter roseus TaxID=2070510 RepID=A0A4R4K3Z3_9BACT|nr:c-type cytochrome domain-containing protein [Arundinibacter roseus]TDB61171.1 cytochrome C [Arundinibacter roseus]